MELAAVAAFHVGQHHHLVLGRAHRRVDDAVGHRQGLQHLAAHLGQRRLGHVLLADDVEQPALEQVLAVVAHVDHLPARDHLAEARDRRGFDAVDPDLRVQLLEHVAHAGFRRAGGIGRLGDRLGRGRGVAAHADLLAGGGLWIGGLRTGGEAEAGQYGGKKKAFHRGFLVQAGIRPDGGHGVPPIVACADQRPPVPNERHARKARNPQARGWCFACSDLRCSRATRV